VPDTPKATAGEAPAPSRRALPDAILFTHLEALRDAASLADVDLERNETASATPALKQRPEQSGAEPAKMQ